jgi:hypothetical protein
MDQTKAMAALAPFVALARSANSPRAVSDLINQATSSPHTYIFAELLQQPNIQSLATHPSLTLLQIFSWGTWETYKGGGRILIPFTLSLTSNSDPKSPPSLPSSNPQTPPPLPLNHRIQKRPHLLLPLFSPRPRIRRRLGTPHHASDL